MQSFRHQTALYSCYEEAPDKPRLVVFPHAGGSAQQWQALFDSRLKNFEVLYVEYPGHGARIREPLASSIAAIVEELAQQIGENWRDNTLFFGYSMGALVAYEVYQCLKKVALAPAHLYINAFPAPNIPQFHINFDKETDEQLLELLERFDPAAKKLLKSAVLADHYILVLKHDFRLLQQYENVMPQSIDCATTILAGKFDGAMQVQDVFAWQELCSVKPELKAFAGDHFFIFDHADKIVELISL